MCEHVGHVFVNVCLSGCTGAVAFTCYTYFWSCHPFPKTTHKLSQRVAVQTHSERHWSTECTNTWRINSLQFPTPFIFVCTVRMWCSCVWSLLYNSSKQPTPTLPTVYSVLSETSALQWLKPNRDAVKECLCLSLCLCLFWTLSAAFSSDWTNRFWPLWFLSSVIEANKSKEWQETWFFFPSVHWGMLDTSHVNQTNLVCCMNPALPNHILVFPSHSITSLFILFAKFIPKVLVHMCLSSFPMMSMRWHMPEWNCQGSFM